MSKTHLHWINHEAFVPEEEKELRRKENLKPTACGFTRKHATNHLEDVTCKHCLTWVDRGKFR